jgi:hypothetical protein
LAFKVLNGELKNDKKSLLKYCEEYLNEEWFLFIFRWF